MKRVGITPTLIILLISVAVIFPNDTIARHFFGIIDYKPSFYIELADEPFFYSINKTLRYGRTINDSSPVLFKGSFLGRDLSEVYVSPDNQKAAFFYGNNLYLAKKTGSAILLLSNCRQNRYYNKIRLGDVYYSNLQWDAESKFVYMIKDKMHVPTPHSCWHAPEVVLVRIDIDSPTNIAEVINNFNSLNYFFVGNNTICFNFAPGNGDVIWKCSQNGIVKEVINFEGNKIFLQGGTVIEGLPFVSYFGNIYESAIWLSNYGFSLKYSGNDVTDFFSKYDSNKPIFRIQGGHNIKGHYVNGISQEGCKVLPGGRYALLDVDHDNFKGQLLVDGLTGKYRKLPAKTKVYLNLNSLNYEHFKFDMGPGHPPKFVPAYDDINHLNK